MTRFVRDLKSSLEHSVITENISKETFTRLHDFIRSNVPTTDRSTPEFREPNLDPEARPTKLIFRFRNEEQAMAFKLIL